MAFLRQDMVVSAHATQGHAPVADRWLNVHTRFAPLLWLMGALHISAALMLLTGVARRSSRGLACNLLVGLWLAIGVFQGLAAVLNGALLSDLSLGFRNALSLTAVGWLFAALGIAAGASSAVSGPAAARLYARLGAYTLVLGAVTLLATGGGLLPYAAFPEAAWTPVTILSSDSMVMQQYAGVRFYQNEITMHGHTTRLVLMYPWAPALGIGSLGLVLISSRCAQLNWRIAGVSGGLLGVIFSWSRLAAALGLVVAAILMFMRAPAWLRVVAALGMAAAVALALLFGVDPFRLVHEVYESLNGARAGSSLARDSIVEQSWAAFLRSPWIGYGWVGESVHPIEYLPIGSHSTIYGTLYTGGLLVFTTFALAMTATVAMLCWRLAREANTQRRKDIEVALCLSLILCISARYEALYSLSLPCFFYFTWIGAAVAAARPLPERALTRVEPPLRHHGVFSRVDDSQAATLRNAVAQQPEQDRRAVRAPVIHPPSRRLQVWPDRGPH
jgi:hypothetical protein